MLSCAEGDSLEMLVLYCFAKFVGSMLGCCALVTAFGVLVVVRF